MLESMPCLTCESARTCLSSLWRELVSGNCNITQLQHLRHVVLYDDNFVIPTFFSQDRSTALNLFVFIEYKDVNLNL